VVLLRLSGELSTKARATRRQFVARLRRNVKDALASAGVAAEIEGRHDRMLVHLEQMERPERAALLTRVFGIQSLSLAECWPVGSLEDLVERGEVLYRERVAGRRFAVRTKVVGSAGAGGLRRREVERALGARLLPHAARVDLSDPEVTVAVELYEGHAYFFTEREAGPGGLPLGSGDRAVALVSGGFDSPVAAWQMLRRGVDLDYVFCNLGGRLHQLGTLRVMKVLADRWSFGARPHLHAVDFAGISRELQARSHPRYWQVILKRWMLRAAEAIAQERGAQAIVTGEAVGQVSSQTLVNLRTIGQATTLPLLRPLVGSNKDEIIARARQIGTGELSALVDEYCALVPRQPATRAKLDVVLRQEAEMDPSVLEKALAERQVLDLRALDPDASGMPELEVKEVPEGACLIDLRTRREYESWHPPEALHLEFGHALEAYPSFARDRTYVLYCEYGLKSAHLAERMQQAGLRAFHLRGGTRALRRALSRPSS